MKIISRDEYEWRIGYAIYWKLDRRLTINDNPLAKKSLGLHEMIEGVLYHEGKPFSNQVEYFKLTEEEVLWHVCLERI